MKIEKSYFVKFPNGTAAWLAAGQPIPEGVTDAELRPMLIPEEGMALRHKETGAISIGHWLREGSEADWEEIPEPKEGE